MELIPAQAPVEAPETILAPVATPTVSQNFFCGTWTKGTAEYIAIGTSSFAYLLLTAFASFVVFRSVQTHRRTVSLDGSHSSPQKGWKLRLTICILLLLGLIRTPSPKKVVRSGSVCYAKCLQARNLIIWFKFFIYNTFCQFEKLKPLSTPQISCLVLF